MTDCRCHSHNGLLTAKGLVETAQRGVDRAHELAVMGIDRGESQLYLDKVRSVSGVRRDEILPIFPDDSQIDEQYRRFLNGW